MKHTPNTKKLREYKKDLKLTQEQREALVGILLGDGHLEPRNGGRTYRLVIEQTSKNEPYIQHLYELFKPWVLEPPKPKKRNTGVNLFFRTISHPEFAFYGQLFYPSDPNAPTGTNFPKIIPKDIHKHFSDRALAYWYMDDGARKGANRSGKRIHTEGFEESQVRELCQALNLYGVETTVNKQKRRPFSQKRKLEPRDPNSQQDPADSYYILYITARGDRVFTEKVQPYILPFFTYKL